MHHPSFENSTAARLGQALGHMSKIAEEGRLCEAHDLVDGTVDLLVELCQEHGAPLTAEKIEEVRRANHQAVDKAYRRGRFGRSLRR